MLGTKKKIVTKKKTTTAKKVEKEVKKDEPKKVVKKVKKSKFNDEQIHLIKAMHSKTKMQVMCMVMNCDEAEIRRTLRDN